MSTAPTDDCVTTLWDSINVALPTLPYKNERLLQQDKGSTKWAAHSHTPCSVSRWDNFDTCIAQESQKPGNLVPFSVDVDGELTGVRLIPVSREQHVTSNTDNLLRAALSDALPNIEFTQTDEYTVTNPDLVALREEVSLVTAEKYESPANPARERVAAMRNAENAALCIFETKPFWKFRFLLDAEDSTQLLLDLWSVPSSFEPEKPLPQSWSHEKQKVFHLIRQIYGQLVSSKLRYGIMHLYQVWWFCHRDENGRLFISRPFRKEETKPSVLQAIVTITGFENFRLENAAIHPQSVAKATGDRSGGGGGAKRKRENPRSDVQRKKGSRQGPPSGNQSAASSSTENMDCAADFVAKNINLWECDLVNVTDNVKLLVSNNFPDVLIKLQRNPSAKHVGLEMEREANIYKQLCKEKSTKNAIAKFYGYSRHLGVAILCTDKQGADFEDIGVENLSLELKLSAVESLRVLSHAGLVHNDLALRNIVQSKTDPNQAKIIDFGRAEFTDNQQLQEEQIQHLQQLLRIHT